GPRERTPTAAAMLFAAFELLLEMPSKHVFRESGKRMPLRCEELADGAALRQVGDNLVLGQRFQDGPQACKLAGHLPMDALCVVGHGCLRVTGNHCAFNDPRAPARRG